MRKPMKSPGGFSRIYHLLSSISNYMLLLTKGHHALKYVSMHESLLYAELSNTIKCPNDIEKNRWR